MSGLSQKPKKCKDEFQDYSGPVGTLVSSHAYLVVDNGLLSRVTTLPACVTLRPIGELWRKWQREYMRDPSEESSTNDHVLYNTDTLRTLTANMVTNNKLQTSQ